MKVSSVLKMMLAAVMVCVIAAEPASAAKRRTATKKKATATAPTVTKGEEKTYGEFLTTALYTIKKGKSDIVVEYPIAGNGPLVNALRAEIKKHVAENFAGPLETPEALLKAGIKALESFETLNDEIKVVYCNGNVVTIKDIGYIYSGGAHGLPFNWPSTFLVSTGEKLTKDMLPSVSSLRTQLVAGLTAYLEGDSYSEAWGVTPVEDLTWGDPAIVADGLLIQYSAYEIGPYAMGLPESIIPLEAVRPLAGSRLMPFLK